MPANKVQETPKGSEERLGDYLKKINESPMFPAFSANIRELLTILEDPYYPVYEVSRIILRDVSLTTQILKLVNTIYFQSRHGQVHTISSAVMIMGFEVVRNLAVGLKLLENFQKSTSLQKVKQLTFESFFMALSAQELAQQDHRFNDEELFLTALLYNFGELVAAYYFPDDYRSMLELLQESGISKTAAVMEVFQFSLEDLGQSLLKIWNFPDKLRAQLADLMRSGRETPGPQGQRRRLFKGVQEISQALLNPDFSPEKRRKLQERMARDLGIKPEIVDKSMRACRDRLQELARILSFDVEDLGLELPPVKTEEAQAAERVDPGEAATAQAEKLPIQESPGPIATPEQEMQRLTFLLQVMEEINQAIAVGRAIHQIIMMILEGIFQGIGFDRVAFCLADPKRTWITGRFGLGKNVETLLPLLKAPFASQSNPLAVALTQNQDCLVSPGTRPQDRQLLEEEFWQASKAQTILITPIQIDSTPIGVIYMDRLAHQPVVSALDRQRVQSFRDQAVIAIRLRSQRTQDGLLG